MFFLQGMPGDAGSWAPAPTHLPRKFVGEEGVSVHPHPLAPQPGGCGNLKPHGWFLTKTLYYLKTLWNGIHMNNIL